MHPSSSFQHRHLPIAELPPLACQNNNLAASDNYLATSDNYFKFQVSPKRLTGGLNGAVPLLKKP
jgi:hypothetical protein